MKSILVANLKGGVGKTVIATTLAAALAQQGGRVALADADKQRSALRWAKRRPGTAAPVAALDWSRSAVFGKRPKKLDWLVIDAPGALRGPAAEALAAEAKAILAPVAPSVFDIDATRRFLKRIEELKRVRKGKAEVSVVANRLRARTRAARALEAALEELGRPPLARIADRSIYAELAEDGLALFDRPQRAYDPLKDQWRPLLDALAD